MSREVLELLALTQGAIVALLFAMLAWHRILRSVRERYRARRSRRIVAAVRSWLAGEATAAQVHRSLRLCSLSAGREAIEALWSSLEPAAIRRVRDLFADTGWLRRARSSTSSLFWWKRMEATQILAYLGTDGDAARLRRRLRDRAPAVRLAAIFAAREQLPPSLLHDLVEELLRAQPALAKALQDALMAYGADVIPALAWQLNRPDLGTEERTNLLALATHVADRHPDPELATYLLPHTSDPQLDVRAKAVRALARIPDGEVDTALRRALSDTAWEVRAQAAKGLGARGKTWAVTALRRALSDPEWWVRLRAGTSLRLLGPRGRSALEAAAEDEDPFARDMATYVLRLDEDALQEYAP